MAEPTLDPVYSLVPAVDVVPLRDGHLLFRSEAVAIRIEGGFARTLEQRVLPLLDGRRRLSQVCAALPDLPPDVLRDRFDALVQSGVFRRTESAVAAAANAPVAIAAAIQAAPADLAAPEARARLAQFRVTIAGLEAHGAHLALLLAGCGVGSLLLVDPFPCEPGNLPLLPSSMTSGAVGVARQETVARAVRHAHSTTRVDTARVETLTRAQIDTLAVGSHLLIGCFDRGFVACHHWLNRAGWSQRIPSLYAELRGQSAFVGPLVIPGQTACFMCYRMRSIACEDDFESAMTYEEYLDRLQRPALHRRATVPTLPSYVASLVALECLKLMLGESTLAGAVLEFTAQTVASDLHPVLQMPDCPVCGGDGGGSRARRRHPLPTDVREPDERTGDLSSAMRHLYSRRTGVVRNLYLVQQDATEPAVPYVMGAELANHRYAPGDTTSLAMCSGKGLTEESARLSTFGEAVERYSGACWRSDEITYARRDGLPEAALDPRQLVLYTSDQYASGRLPYAPYTGENVLGWTPARSLVSGEWMYVPAQAVFLGYTARGRDEFLCPITSNGLATGPTILAAALAATCEVLERDAFMITWMNRLPCACVDPGTHPDRDVRDFCEAYRRRSVELRLFKLPTDHPCHVFAALALQTQPVREDTPAAVVGLGADMDIQRAAKKALLEIGQVRPALRHRLRRPETRRRLDVLVADPHQVTTLDDHDLLYASPDMTRAFEFWLDRHPEPVDWSLASYVPAAVEERLELLVQHVRRRSGDLLYSNVTPADMAALGLHTVRAIIPDFQPIHFGWAEARLGGDRLYALPVALGFTAARPTAADLNDAPHPLA